MLHGTYSIKILKVLSTMKWILQTVRNNNKDNINIINVGLFYFYD
jgi:hypothetical protein